MILAILGYFELWALSFFPLMFQDASVIPFFFPSLDWNCFLAFSCSFMFICLESTSVDFSGSLQKGFVLSWSEFGCSWLDSLISDSADVVLYFQFQWALFFQAWLRGF